MTGREKEVELVVGGGIKQNLIGGWQRLLTYQARDGTGIKQMEVMTRAVFR